jgi:hypothetical protein
MLTYIQTPQGVTVVLGGKIRTISAKEAHYEDILTAIKTGQSESDVNEILEKELKRMTAAVEKVITSDVRISGGQVLFRNEAIHNSLTDRMLKMLDEGFDLQPMAAFLTNLVQNPDARAVNDLYAFLEHGMMPVTPDGHFLAYKAVRPDYKDIHSGTFDNSVGQTPEMLRFKVDNNPNQTCSRGLHVCSFDYLPHFSHANGHVMICKVNPKDVVAIPADYNNTKMRVSRYEVIAEYADYYKEHPECLLSQVSVATESEPFSVETRGLDGLKFTAYALLSQASAAAEASLELTSTESVKITNITTDTVVFDKYNDAFEGYPDDDEEFDDEDGDGDGDEDEVEFGNSVIYFRSKSDFDAGARVQYSNGMETKEAKDIALHVFQSHDYYAVQVIAQDGEVEFTVSRG